jgi:hypothetical protein
MAAGRDATGRPGWSGPSSSTTSAWTASCRDPVGPTRPPRDGFTHGGWAEPNNDDTMGRAWGKRLAASGGSLLGRRTYQDVLAYWNTQDSPFRDALNHAPKYVASNSLTEPPPGSSSPPIHPTPLAGASANASS